MSGTIALSIPGLFLTCVKYFELIQLGQGFQSDYESCMVQLRGTELRLQRWGRAAGITDDYSTDFMKIAGKCSEKEMLYAESALQQIQTQLKLAQIKSAEAKNTEQPSPARSSQPLAIEDREDTEEANPPISRVRKALDKSRQSYAKVLRFGTELNDKTRWALYRKAALTELISKASEHISTLERLFPAQIADLAKTEAVEITALPSEDVLLLRKVLQGLDPLLEQALNAKAPLTGNTFSGMKAFDSSKQHIGNNYKQGRQPGQPGDTFSDMEFGGSSENHVGNNYG